MFAVMAYAITVTASFTTANLFGGGIVMVRWLIIGFLLVCLILFMLEVGQAIDYDPEWDDPEWKEREVIPEDEEEGDQIDGE